MRAGQLGWRLVYEALATRVRRSDWAFMNYGYVPPADGAGAGADSGAGSGAGEARSDLTGDGDAVRVELDERDEADRLFIQLYRRALAGVPVRDADVLEVGSGRGGGASYVARYLEPRSMTGLDFSRLAVDLSRERRRGPGLAFVHGDASAMPFPDDSFDVVLNVESSHCYASMEAFLAEVHRVLRPGGTFCWVDFRGEAGAVAVRRELAESPLVVTDEGEITPGVLAALRLDNDRKAAFIEAWFPRVLHRPLHRFAATTRSTTFTRFDERDLRYLSARATKSPTVG